MQAKKPLSNILWNGNDYCTTSLHQLCGENKFQTGTIDTICYVRAGLAFISKQHCVLFVMLQVTIHYVIGRVACLEMTVKFIEFAYLCIYSLMSLKTIESYRKKKMKMTAHLNFKLGYGNSIPASISPASIKSYADKIWKWKIFPQSNWLLVERESQLGRRISYVKISPFVQIFVDACSLADSTTISSSEAVRLLLQWFF